VDTERRAAKGKDYFGDFLDSMSSVNPGSAAEESAADAPEPESEVVVESRQQESSLSLPSVLAYLRGHDDQSLPEIARGLRSPILETAEVINKLHASNVVTLEGKPGSERVKLTEAGVNLSSVT
jgi:hypothetical protein